MSDLILDKTCNALMNQLREMDRQRDHLRAQLADAAMHVELAEVDRNLLWGLDPERRAEIKAEREAAIRERIAVRARRREKEMRLFGAYVRPGTWDADLDKYQEPKYEEDVGDGYKIRLVRARDLTWNAYVILPEGHCAIGKHYDFFGGYEAPQGMPRPPVHITYGGKDHDGGHEAEVGVYGFYLTNIVKPREKYAEYDRHHYFSVEETGATIYDDGSKHYSYHKMRKLCLELVEYFKQLAADPVTAAICREPPPEEKPAAAAVQYFTSMRAPTSAAAEKPAVKKSWAAVAAGK